MDSRIANEFLEACNESFGFLVSDFGFQPGTLEVDSQIQFATVSYVGKNLAVECIFDERESWVEVKVARVKNGVRPANYSTDGAGRRVRENLYSLLIESGVREFGPRDPRPSSKPQNEMFRIKLAKDANLLRKHGKEILQDSSTLLDT
jgi:hypothetical protein